MKKIINLIIVLALTSTLATANVACSTGDKFNIWNISTWGNDQKSMIIKSYLKSAKSFYRPFRYQPHEYPTWNDWVQNEESDSLNDAFQLINTLSSVGANIVYTVEPTPKGDLEQVLAKGVNYYFECPPKAGQVLSGNMSVLIEGII